jgi:lipopolysaccharide export system permease protein
MDRIDRYILRQFVQTFFFAIIAFVAIYITVNLMENLDDFFDRNVSNDIIIKYYIYRIPDIVQLVVPIAMLLASLFTIGRLDQSNELTAIRSSGRSMRRLAVPLLSFGLIMSFVMVYFNGWVVPVTNKEYYAIDRKYLGRNLIGGQHNVFLRLSPSLNLLMEYFDPTTGEARRVSMERFDTAAPVVVADISGRTATELQQSSDTAHVIKITERVDATTMRYDSVSKTWILLDGVARNFDDPNAVVTTKFTERELPGLPVTPEELNLSQQNIYELTLAEHRSRIRQETLSGRDLTKFWIDYYSRIAFPFSALIVIFFGIPFSNAQRKGGAAVTIAVTGLISAIYLILTEVSKAFTYGLELPPALTAWMANLVFLVVGIGNLIRVERG